MNSVKSFAPICANSNSDDGAYPPFANHFSLLAFFFSLPSEEGFVSIYFSSQSGRLMSEEEWMNLRELIELSNRVCIKQQARAQTAGA